MEGEAKESFAAIPGLASRGALNPFLLLISDNNTKLTGRIDSDSFSMNPTFESLETLGWTLIKVEQGHDLQKVYWAIEEGIELAKMRPTHPVALWFKTIKGKGVKNTEESKSGGHGYPLKAYDSNLPAFIQEIYAGNAPAEFISWANAAIEKKSSSSSSAANTVKTEKVQVGLSKALINAAKSGLPVFSITADLPGSTGVAEFQKEFPGHWIDVGVAESNMISAAAGLSRAGLIPIVDTFAQFGITKGNLPLTMANLSLAPVVGLFSHTGLQDAADGASHQATTYFSATSSIPHTDVISVASSSEAEFFLSQALERFAQDRRKGKIPESYLFFYGRENFPQHYGTTEYQWEKPVVLRQGKDVLLVGTGPTVAQALAAAELLKQQGIDATVVNHVFINRPCQESFKKLLNQNQMRLVTMEDHQVIGGMGALLCHALSRAGMSFKAKSLGIDGKFGQSAYLAEQLYQRFGISAQDMANAAKALVNA
jgi:transketolase